MTSITYRVLLSAVLKVREPYQTLYVRALVVLQTIMPCTKWWSDYARLWTGIFANVQ